MSKIKQYPKQINEFMRSRVSKIQTDIENWLKSQNLDPISDMPHLHDRLMCVPIFIQNPEMVDYKMVKKWCNYAVSKGLEINITRARARNKGYSINPESVWIHYILDATNLRFDDILLPYALEKSDKFAYTAKPKTPTLKDRRKMSKFEELKVDIAGMANYSQNDFPHILNDIPVLFIDYKETVIVNAYRTILNASGGGYKLIIDCSVPGGAIVR